MPVVLARELLQRCFQVSSAQDVVDAHQGVRRQIAAVLLDGLMLRPALRLVSLAAAIAEMRGQSGRDEQLVLRGLVLLADEARDGVQIGGLQMVARGRQQAHRPRRIRSVAAHRQQVEQILRLRGVHHSRGASGLARQTKGFERGQVDGHSPLGAQQHGDRRQRTVRFLERLARRPFGVHETLDGLGFQFQAGIAGHSHRAWLVQGRGPGVGGAALAHRAQLGDRDDRPALLLLPTRLVPQRIGQAVGAVQHEPAVALGQRQFLDVLFVDVEPVDEQLEGIGTRAAERVDGLERVAHGRHVGRSIMDVDRLLRMEQRRQQQRLRRGCVLVLVKEHVAVAAAVLLADRREALNQLERVRRVIRVLGKTVGALSVLVFLGQVDDHRALACHVVLFLCQVDGFPFRVRSFLRFRQPLRRILPHRVRDDVVVVRVGGLRFQQQLAQLRCPRVVPPADAPDRRGEGRVVLGIHVQHVLQALVHHAADVFGQAYAAELARMQRRQRAGHARVQAVWIRLAQALAHLVELAGHHLRGKLVAACGRDQGRLRVDADEQAVPSDDLLEEGVVGGNGRLPQ